MDKKVIPLSVYLAIGAALAGILLLYTFTQLRGRQAPEPPRPPQHAAADPAPTPTPSLDDGAPPIIATPPPWGHALICFVPDTTEQDNTFISYSLPLRPIHFSQALAGDAESRTMTQQMAQRYVDRFNLDYDTLEMAPDDLALYRYFYDPTSYAQAPQKQAGDVVIYLASRRGTRIGAVTLMRNGPGTPWQIWPGEYPKTLKVLSSLYDPTDLP
nr:hypothetical protein [bacterium]